MSIGNQWIYGAAGQAPLGATGTVKYFYPGGTGEYIDVGDTAVESVEKFYSNPVVRVANIAISGLLAYHGYKRNRGSIMWAVIWGVFMPNVVGVPVALVQGFGKPARK